MTKRPRDDRHDPEPERPIDVVEWLRRMAELEDACGSVSVGGLAYDLGLLRAPIAADHVAESGGVWPAKSTPLEAVKEGSLPPVPPFSGPDDKSDYQVVDRQVQPVASIRVKCTPTQISTILAELLSEIMAHCHATGAKLAGPPFSRYHSRSAEALDLEAGIPVQKPIIEKGRVVNSELPAGRAVMAWHVGPYEKLADANNALQAHLTGKKLKARGGPWEVYWTEPGMVRDPAEGRTQLFAPIE